MPLEGQLVTRHDAGENRKEVRRRLHLHASGSANGGTGLSVLIHDMSESGLLLQTEGRLPLGERFEVILPLVGARWASVVWASGDFLGCQFEEPIGRAALSAAELRSEPPAPDAPDADPGASSESFGTRLRRMRRERKISLIGLARLLGVSKPTVWKWERGDVRPRQKSLEALAAVLDVPQRDLIFGEAGSPPPPPSELSAEPRRREDHRLNEVVKACKERIAGAAGTSPHNVSVSIRL